MLTVKIALLGFMCLLASHLSCASLHPVGEASLIEGLNQIDKYLSSDDIKENMAAISSWLIKLDKKSRKCLTRHRSATLKLIAVLERVIELKKKVDAGKCNVETAMLVNEFELAVGSPSLLYQDNPPRKIEKLVYEIGKSYYDLCYPDKISPKVDQLNSESLNHVLNLAKGLIGNEVWPSENDSGAKIFIKLIRSFVTSETESGTDNKEYQVTRGDFNRYMLDPCKDLEQVMGTDFGDISRAQLVFDLDREKTRQIYRKRAAVKSCYFILKNEDKLWQDMLDGMTKENKMEAELENPTYIKSDKFASYKTEGKKDEGITILGGARMTFSH